MIYKTMKKVSFLLLSIMSFTFVNKLYAQIGYNPSSIRPVLETDVMFRKSVVRLVNLKEKQNKPFFAEGQWITKVIIEGVKSGELKPYRCDTDSTNAASEMTLAEFNQNMLYDPQDSTQGDLGPRDIQFLEMREDVIFDKRRSRMYYDIQTVKIIAPPQGNSPIQREVAKFPYRQLAEYFRKVYARTGETQAVWYNPQNNRRQMNFSDAMDLRLFASRVIKVSNPDNNFIDREFPNPKDQLRVSQQAEYDLMEYEHNLWEF